MQDDILNSNDEYQYGFKDSYQPVYSTGKGLNEKKLCVKFQLIKMSLNGC